MPDNLTGPDYRLRVAIDEEDRLAALSRYAILDTAAEPFYDRLATMLHDACHMDWAAITFVDHHRQWFKARGGFKIAETPRNVSFCSVAMHSSQPLVVRDATQDSRFHDNTLVTGEPHIRSYFGMPIFSDEGFGLGSVCVIAMDQPRSLRPCHMQLLASARDWVQASLAARLLTLEAPATLAASPRLKSSLSQLHTYAAWHTSQTWKSVEDAYKLCSAADNH